MKIQIGIIAMVVLLTVMEDYVVVYVHACFGEQQHIIEEPNAKDFYATRKGRDHHVEEPIGVIRQIWKLMYVYFSFIHKNQRQIIAKFAIIHAFYPTNSTELLG